MANETDQGGESDCAVSCHPWLFVDPTASSVGVAFPFAWGLATLRRTTPPVGCSRVLAMAWLAKRATCFIVTDPNHLERVPLFLTTLYVDLS